MSQDHLELLFACIRGKNGFNNNPNVVQLKSSLCKVLLRNSIIGSKNANCLTFDEHAAGSIFSRRWNNRNSPPAEKPELEDDKQFISDISSKLDSYHLLSYKDALLGYLAGFVVRKILKNISCPTCASALYLDANSFDHQYSHFSGPSYLSLLNLKNHDGLFLPTKDVFEIVHTSEKVFQVAVCGIDTHNPVISSNKNIQAILVHTINQHLANKDLFSMLNNHDLEHETLTEDLHSSQLMKKIIEKYVTIRLLTYRKHYSKDVLHKDKIGVRQQATKLVLFKGI